MKKYFQIGQIVNTHGIKGFIKIKPFTDDIANFKNFKTIYIDMKDELKSFDVQEVKFSKNSVLIKLKGIDSIEEAENYRNYYIKVDRDIYKELEDNSYYIEDLISCNVYTDEGKFLGILEDVFSTGSNDVYVVKNNLGKQILLPAISEIIKQIDVQDKKIIVHLIEGLL